VTELTDWGDGHATAALTLCIHKVTNITYSCDHALPTTYVQNSNDATMTGMRRPLSSKAPSVLCEGMLGFGLGHFTDDAVAEGPLQAHNGRQKFSHETEYGFQPTFIQ
jgi:hypothetical protein